VFRFLRAGVTSKVYFLLLSDLAGESGFGLCFVFEDGRVRAAIDFITDF
jgi:hypothetical protein